MILEPPSYIPIKHLCELSNSYDWDDWDPYEVVGEINEELVDRLGKLSYRAVIIFSIGCAEWVVWRFKEKADDDSPFKYLESCWAYILTNLYETPPELEDEDWKGSVRGSINLALMTVLNSIYCVEDDCPEAEAAYADRVALHVLGNDRLYIEWRDKVLLNLEKAYPRVDTDPNGPLIPREALDYHIKFKKEESDVLIKKFLSSIDVSNNPFLILLKRKSCK